MTGNVGTAPVTSGDSTISRAGVATALSIIDSLDLLAIPVLFNRWVGRPEFDVLWFSEIEAADFERDLAPFIESMVAPQTGREVILAWHLCNEAVQTAKGAVGHGEAMYNFDLYFSRQLEWLEFTRERVRSIDTAAKTCIGYMNSFDSIEHRAQFEALGDLLTPHLYEWHAWRSPHNHRSRSGMSAPSHGSWRASPSAT